MAHDGPAERTMCNRVQALKPVSMKDIARRAQVSHSTVSRALQNSPLVNRGTAEKIRLIAEESGYRVSAVARGLATSKTRTVGLVVTTIADPFVAGVVGGIEDAANANGYSVVLANSHADPRRTHLPACHCGSEDHGCRLSPGRKCVRTRRRELYFAEHCGNSLREPRRSLLTRW